MNKKAIQPFSQSLSAGSLGAYIHWANKIPLLTLDEERHLAQQLKEHKDVDAARKMVMAHLRFVIRIARGYAGYGLAEADLIQEGNIGLMKAVKRFDVDVGVRLVSFAVHWIRAEIHEFVLKNWRIVKIATTKAQRKLFFNLRKAAKKRGWFSQNEVESIAENLNVTEKDVRQMEARLNNYDQAFDGYSDDTPSSSQGSLPHFAPSQFLAADAQMDPEQSLINHNFTHDRNTRLRIALKQLDDRSQDILAKRWLADKKHTLHQLAASYNVSAERIRQLEKNAMQKIRHLMNQAA